MNNKINEITENIHIFNREKQDLNSQIQESNQQNEKIRLQFENQLQSIQSRVQNDNSK